MKAGVKRKGDFCNFFFTQEVPTKSVLLTHATRSTMNSRRQKTSSSCHSTESPPWFREFAREQRRCLEDIIKINKEALKVAKERNNILQAFTEAFLKRESYAERKLSSTSKDCHGEWTLQFVSYFMWYISFLHCSSLTRHNVYTC